MSERHTRIMWINVYRKGQSVWPTKEDAEKNARPNCIATVEASFSFVEGQGRDASAARS